MVGVTSQARRVGISILNSSPSPICIAPTPDNSRATPRYFISMSSTISPADTGDVSPQSPSPPPPPRKAFGHGGKRVRNADRSVYDKTDFHRQPHPTALKRITWQDVLSGPFKDLPAAERRKVANHIRSTARNLAQLLVINNSTPPIYRDNETCTVAEPPWVPDFFESERDWKPSVPKDQVCLSPSMSIQLWVNVWLFLVFLSCYTTL